MSFVTKYRIQWQSIEGVACKIEIAYPDYSGSIIELTPSSSPFVFSEDQSDDPFTPVRGQTGTIGIVITSSSDITLLSDIIPDRYNTALVSAFRSNTLKWLGFVSPQAFTQPWVQAPFEIDIPVYDFVQSLYYERIPTSLRSENFNFAYLFEKGVYKIFGDDVQVFGVYIESDFNLQNTYDCFMRYRVPTQFYFEQVNSDSDATTNYDGISYGEAFEHILQTFGMCLRNAGNCIFYFQIMSACRGQSDDNGIVRLSRLLTMEDIYYLGDDHLDDLGFLWNQGDDDITDSDVVRADGSVSINQSANGVKVDFSIDRISNQEYLLLPAHDQEGVSAVTWPAMSVRAFTTFPANITGYVSGCRLIASVYEETDPQEPDYGVGTITIMASFYTSSDWQTLNQYLTLYPGTCPTIPQPNSGTAVTDTVVGAQMCKYKRTDDDDYRDGVFFSVGINSLGSGSIPKIFNIATPASVTLDDGILKLNLSLFALTNYPYGGSNTDFSIGLAPKKIRFAISIGNNRYTGNSSAPWSTGSSEIIVASEMFSDLSIPITSELSGVLQLSVYGLFEGEDYNIYNSIWGYTNIFFMLTDLSVTFNPNQEDTTNDRNNNLYFEQAAGYGDNYEILLSIGSDQNNKRANNILQDNSNNVVSKITYNNSDILHPERRLAQRAAEHYRTKQTVYEFTTALHDFSPTDQPIYNTARAAILKTVDWLYDIQKIKLIEQKS